MIKTVNWIYRFFIDQECVFENQYQYSTSNCILTEMILKLLMDGVITPPIEEAIESFQTKMSGKEHYMALWIHKAVTMTYYTMTTSPVESINRNIKHKSRVSLCPCYECVYFFVRLRYITNLFKIISLYTIYIFYKSYITGIYIEQIK